MDIDQYDAPLRACAPRESLPRLGAARALADDDLCGRSAPSPIDRAHGHRRAHGRRDVFGLCAPISVPNAPARRHRDSRQPQQSQGGRSRGSHHHDRSHRPLFATLLSGSEPDRKVFSKLKARLRKAAKRDSMPSGRKSGNGSIRSPQTNAQTSSPLADMQALKSKPL